MNLPSCPRIFISIIFTILFTVTIQAETVFLASLDSFQEVPQNTSTAAGTGTVILNDAETQVTITLYINGLSSPQTAAHIHSPAARGANADVVQALPNGNFSQTFPITAKEVANLKNGLWYFNVHTDNFPNGEIRGQVEKLSDTNAVSFPFSNGSLDTTFDSDGKLNTQINDGNSALAVAIQPDGKIVIVGFDQTPGNTDFAAVRYNPDGSLDTSFGNGGSAITPIGTSFEEAFAIAIQPDGKLVLAGRTFNGTDTDFAMIRYNSDGTLDTTFDSDGILTTTIGPGNEIFRSVAIQSDGKIVAAGDSFNGSDITATVVRYNSDGSLDTTFDGNAGNGDGVVTTRIGSNDERIYGLKLQSDGKIITTGYLFNGTNNDVIVIRYNTDGTLDKTFDKDGSVVTAVGTVTDESFAIDLQSDGKIVVVGCVNDGPGNDFLTIRYNSDGSLDNSFGTNGATSTPIGVGGGFAVSVAIQSDGKIVSGGRNRVPNDDFAVVRQNPDGSLDTSFDGDGKVITQINENVEFINGIAIQADGKIVAVGRSVVGTSATIGIVRYGYGTNATTDNGFFKLNQTTEIRFDNAFLAGNTTAKPSTALGLPPIPNNLNLINTPQIIQTTANFNGDIVVKFTLPNDTSEANFNAAQVLQFENGAWADKTANTPARDFSTRTIYARVQKLSAFAVVSTLAQSPTNILINGRVFMANGRAVNLSSITYVDENGQTRYARTNPFGYFRFKNVKVGDPFIFRANSKSYKFAPRIMSVNKDFGEIVFTAEP